MTLRSHLVEFAPPQQAAVRRTNAVLTRAPRLRTDGWRIDAGQRLSLWLDAAAGRVVIGAGLALWRGWEAASLAPIVTAAAGGATGFVMLWSVARGYRLLRGREGMGGGDLERLPLRALLMRAVIADMGEPADLLQTVQHEVGAIGAIVGEDQKVGHPCRAVMGQPFQKEARLVLDRQNTQDPHGPDRKQAGPKRQTGSSIGRRRGLIA